MISRENWKLDLDEVEVVLGVWLFASPWVFGQAEDTTKIGLMSLLGLLVTADGMWALAKPGMRSPEWVMVVLGLAAAFSPWAFGMMGQAALTWNAWIVGAALVVLGAVAFFTTAEESSGRTRMAH
jgi:hypothetical protein